ncbi:MAG TPA: hypothetical protein VIM70_09585 [Clostridium sp.]
MKDFFLFFPILIIAWLGYATKHISEIVTEKCALVLSHNLIKEGK